MKSIVKFLGCILLSVLPSSAQSTLNLQNPIDAPVGSFAADPESGSGQSDFPKPLSNLAFRLTVKDAEAIAMKNNPAISEARLVALASHQATREVRSNLWPQVTANFTGVDAHDDSRISAGGLNNSIIYTRAAAGTTFSQLITDFGHTSNLVASARFHEEAEGQNALATKEQILLAVDQAFYGVLQTHAVLRVAEQTVASRQLLSDQVSALTKSKLKSGLDLSFANVNLSQAKLLFLDASNNDKAAMAAFSSVLGYGTVEDIDLVSDPEPVAPPPADINQLLTDAFSKRPEILSMEFEAKSTEKLHRADHDQFFPTITALGAIGDAPFRDDRISSWYGAAGINVQVPIFNGLLSTAKSRESALQAKAADQRVLDLRNRISRDVRTSWLNASTAYDRVSVNRQLLAQASQALDLAQTRYKLGLSSIVELSQAQLQQTQAEIGSAQAEYAYRLALSVLRYQSTGL